MIQLEASGPSSGFSARYAATTHTEPDSKPIDEIAQSYTGMLRAWRGRLAYDGLVDDPQVERTSRGLGRHLIAMLALGEHRLWQPEGLSATEWTVAREIAKDLLRRIDDLNAPGELDLI